MDIDGGGGFEWGCINCAGICWVVIGGTLADKDGGGAGLEGFKKIVRCVQVI